jgi:hypothetical protein
LGIQKEEGRLSFFPSGPSSSFSPPTVHSFIHRVVLALRGFLRANNEWDFGREGERGTARKRIIGPPMNWEEEEEKGSKGQ